MECLMMYGKKNIKFSIFLLNESLIFVLKFYDLSKKNKLLKKKLENISFLT